MQENGNNTVVVNRSDMIYRRCSNAKVGAELKKWFLCYTNNETELLVSAMIDICFGDGFPRAEIYDFYYYYMYL